MKTCIPKAATQAMKSVVIVFDSKFDDDYSTGFVVVKARSPGLFHKTHKEHLSLLHQHL